MLDVDLPTIRRRLAAHTPHRHTGDDPERWAAVATILRDGPEGAEVLLIRRAEREGDPWSGHVAFPGGHRDPGDRDLLDTARRETREEVGIDLEHHELLGALDEHPATRRGHFTGIVIAPYVFALREEPRIVPNHEVDEVFWAPLGPIVRGERDAMKAFEHEGEDLRFPGYQVGDDVLWGLTRRMLHGLFGVLAGRPFEP